MLRKENAIRIQSETYPSREKSGRSPIKLFIFKCKKCINEIRSRNAYLKKHSGLCIICSNRKSLKKALKKRRLRPYESVFNFLMTREQGCDLTYDQFLCFVKIKTCHYCKEKINWLPYGKATRYNLDRKNNDLGYNLLNIVVCCGNCNMTKGNRFSYQEFIQIGKVIEMIKESR